VNVWIDAQLPPALATWLRRAFPVEATHLLELGLVNAKDERIFQAARSANAIVVTKDSDFVHLLERSGPPPRVLWITLGNVRNAQLWQLLERHWERALAHFEAGEALVELGRALAEEHRP
jgi:predicted nuclease of predicted toxin-antitoxin system